MTNYRAIVSVTFDDSDLAELAGELGVELEQMDAHDTIGGELDNLGFGNSWIEQFFEDGEPTIGRLSDGITVEVNPHEAP